MRTAEYVLYSPSLRAYLGINDPSGGYLWVSSYLSSAFITEDISQLKKIQTDIQSGKFPCAETYLGSTDWVLRKLHMVELEEN